MPKEPSMEEYCVVLGKLRQSGSTWNAQGKVILELLEPTVNTSGARTALKVVESNMRAAIVQVEAAVLRSMENINEEAANAGDIDEFAEYYGKEVKS